MAQNRTFQFYGQGYGSTPVSITARINNTLVFSGEIPTVDLPVNPQPAPPLSEQPVIVTIPDSAALNTDFAGSLPMTITVAGGTGVIFGEIFANYYQGNLQTDPNAGISTGFAQCYIGNPVNSEGTPDTRSSVQINGVTQVPPLDKSVGCWNWFLQPGDTMTYNWNISIGQVANVSGNVTNYAGEYTTIAPTYP